ncbi:MAG TPA: HNH endonuclease signature motif containing protein [bacterium]|nr:HNH endonuclease signature motif containing protein [bacterium]
MSIAGLPTRAITRRLHDLLNQGRRLDVEVLLHLAEIERRRGWSEYGFAGLWDYCRRELGLLECATYRRVHATRILMRFPDVAGPLRDGRLSLSTIVELRDVLTPENAQELVARASGKSRREVEVMVAQLRAPIPVPAATIRKVAVAGEPVARTVREEVSDVPGLPTAAEGNASLRLQGEHLESMQSAPPEPAAPFVPVPPRPEVEPIARNQYRVRMVVSQEFVDLLERAKTILSHVVPDGELTDVLRKGLEEIVRKHEKKIAPRKRRLHKKAARLPEAQRGARVLSGAGGKVPNNAAVPRAVSAEVWRRDEGKCVWRLANGETCGSTHQVEGDHIVPRAWGGASTPENMRLLCRAHNLEHARNLFGDEFMDRFRSTGGELGPREEAGVRDPTVRKRNGTGRARRAARAATPSLRRANAP